MSTGKRAAPRSPAPGNSTMTAGAADGLEGVTDSAPLPAAGMPVPAAPESKRGKRGGEMGAPPSFLDKLCDILDDASLSHHIAWNKEGDGIAIKQVEHFAAKVLPKYYKHSNYQSFVRQLNIYGFHKTRHEEHYVEVEFKHPHFRREQRHLLGLIRRKSHSSTSPKQQRDDNVFSLEAKYIIDRVTAEMRRLCNRVSALEAQIWVTNDRFNTVKLESSALWCTVLEEGSDQLRKKAEKAIEAARHMALTSSELHVFQPEGEQAEKVGRPLPLPLASGPCPPFPHPPPRQASSMSMASSDISFGRQRSGMAVPSPAMATSSAVGRGGGANSSAAGEPQSGDNFVASANLPRASFPAAGAAADQLISDSLLSLAAAAVPTTPPSPNLPFTGAPANTAAGGGSRSSMPSSTEMWQETSGQETPVSSAHSGFSAVGGSVCRRDDVRGWNSSYTGITQSADALSVAVAASEFLTSDDTGDRGRNNPAYRGGHERRDEIDTQGNAVGDTMTRGDLDRSDIDLSSNVSVLALGRRSSGAVAGGASIGNHIVGGASGEVGDGDRGAAGRSPGDAGGKGAGKRLLERGQQEIQSSWVDSSRRRRLAS